MKKKKNQNFVNYYKCEKLSFPFSQLENKHRKYKIKLIKKKRKILMRKVVVDVGYTLLQSFHPGLKRPLIPVG